MKCWNTFYIENDGLRVGEIFLICIWRNTELCTMKVYLISINKHCTIWFVLLNTTPLFYEILSLLFGPFTTLKNENFRCVLQYSSLLKSWRRYHNHAHVSMFTFSFYFIFLFLFHCGIKKWSAGTHFNSRMMVWELVKIFWDVFEEALNFAQWKFI